MRQAAVAQSVLIVTQCGGEKLTALAEEPDLARHSHGAA
jgi:hypothetical protein